MTGLGDLDAPAMVDSLDLSCLDRADLANLVLQRSEVLHDLPRSGRVIRAWEAGDEAPLQEQIARLGTEIARRAARVIAAEYALMQPLLRELGPARVADIGCGYALFDLFLARDLGAELLLIDLESNERRHFGFQEQGAAYSSLARARQLLQDNLVGAERIRTLNPREMPPEDAGPVDLAVSFLSCGFHYPVDAYLPFLDRALAPGGAAIFDLRMATADRQAAQLAAFGPLTDLPAPPKCRRVLLRKGGTA